MAVSVYLSIKNLVYILDYKKITLTLTFFLLTYFFQMIIFDKLIKIFYKDIAEVKFKIKQNESVLLFTEMNRS